MLDPEEKRFLVIFYSPTDDTVRTKNCQIVSKDPSISKRGCDGVEIASVNARVFLTETYQSVLGGLPWEIPSELATRIEKLVTALENEEVADSDDGNAQLLRLRETLTIRIFLEKMRLSLAADTHLSVGANDGTPALKLLTFLKTLLIKLNRTGGSARSQKLFRLMGDEVQDPQGRIWSKISSKKLLGREAPIYCKKLGIGWVLPTQEDLEDIADWGRFPAGEYFQASFKDNFWTSATRHDPYNGHLYRAAVDVSNPKSYLEWNFENEDRVLPSEQQWGNGAWVVCKRVS
ncbi:MAG: hypothetical protein HYZ71_12570 [Deltaproteobacteria bacterium]|nr:hypothetical protein [Deltaproteobacteria bacterium]